MKRYLVIVSIIFFNQIYSGDQTLKREISNLQYRIENTKDDTIKRDSWNRLSQIAQDYYKRMGKYPNIKLEYIFPYDQQNDPAVLEQINNAKSLFESLHQINYAKDKREAFNKFNKLLNDSGNKWIDVVIDKWVLLPYATYTSMSKDIITVLLDRNADVNAVGDDHATALLFAAANNLTDIVELLLSHSADPFIKTNNRVDGLEMYWNLNAIEAAFVDNPVAQENYKLLKKIHWLKDYRDDESLSKEDKELIEQENAIESKFEKALENNQTIQLLVKFLPERESLLKEQFSSGPAGIIEEYLGMPSKEKKQRVAHEEEDEEGSQEKSAESQKQLKEKQMASNALMLDIKLSYEGGRLNQLSKFLEQAKKDGQINMVQSLYWRELQGKKPRKNATKIYDLLDKYITTALSEVE